MADQSSFFKDIFGWDITISLDFFTCLLYTSSDAESSAYRLKGRNGRDCISSEDVSDSGLCQTALFWKFVLRPSAFPQ